MKSVSRLTELEVNTISETTALTLYVYMAFVFSQGVGPLRYRIRQQLIVEYSVTHSDIEL